MQAATASEWVMRRMLDLSMASVRVVVSSSIAVERFSLRDLAASVVQFDAASTHVVFWIKDVHGDGCNMLTLYLCSRRREGGLPVRAS